jgi:hypothetical protein
MQNRSRTEKYSDKRWEPNCDLCYTNIKCDLKRRFIMDYFICTENASS